MSKKVTVIGGGAAGAAAALAARAAGAETALVRESWGATALGTGLWDIIGVAPYDRMTRFANIGQGMVQVCRRYPDHPYSILSDSDPTRAEEIARAAVEFLRGKLSAQGIEMVGDCSANHWFLNFMGMAKVSCLAPKSMAAGAVENLKGKKAALVGVSGFSEFRAQYLAESLKQLLGSEAGEVRALGVPLPGLEKRGDLIAVELARFLDDEKNRGKALESISAALGDFGPDVIGFPPVIGLDRPAEALAGFESGLGVPVFEVVPQGPSVPGFRLQRAMEAALNEADVRIVPGAVQGFTADDGVVSSLDVMAAERLLREETEVVVLATGRYIGRGIVREDGAFRETVFDLPVFNAGRPVRNAPVQSLLSQGAFDAHPVFSVGVRVGPDLRPLDDLGDVLYENLYAAGSALADYDYIIENSGMGVAAATGLRAGANAAAHGSA